MRPPRTERRTNSRAPAQGGDPIGAPNRAPLAAGPHHEFNDAISITVLCADQEELDRTWEALLAGGGKPQACGWLIDRYGLRWQVVPEVFETMMSDPDAERSRRVTDAMMTMIKFDIAALERAHRG